MDGRPSRTSQASRHTSHHSAQHSVTTTPSPASTAENEDEDTIIPQVDERRYVSECGGGVGGKLNLAGLLRPMPSVTKFIESGARFDNSKLVTHHAGQMQRDINDQVIAKRAEKVKYGIHHKIWNEKKAAENAPHVETMEEAMKSLGYLAYTDDDFVDMIRESVRNTPMGTLPEAWVKEMCKNTTELQARHPEKHAELVKKIREQYVDIIHECTLREALTPHFMASSIWALEERWPWTPQFEDMAPWAGLVEARKQVLTKRLLLLHPVVYSVFRKATELLGRECLIDFEGLRKMPAMKPQHMKDVMVKNIRVKGQELIDDVNESLREIFVDSSQLQQYGPKEFNRIQSLIQTVIVTNARQLFFNTINELVYSYENAMTALPHFILEVAMEREYRIDFYPRYHEFMYCIRKIYETAFETVNSISNANRILGGHAHGGGPIVSEHSTYKVDVDQDYVRTTRQKLSEIVKDWMTVPKKLIKKLNKKYGALINGEAQAYIEEFISPETNFYDALAQLKYFTDFANACYEIPPVIYFENFQFNNEEITFELLETANFYYFSLLEYLVERFRGHSARVIAAFVHIREKLLKTPENTQELRKLMDYNDYARAELLPRLKESVAEGVKQHFALLDVYMLGVEELESVARVQTWHRQILPVFEKSAFMIEDAREKFEEQLAKALVDMRADISKLHRRIKDDFSMYGNYENCKKYMNDLKHIEARIQALEERIEWINNEETLFKLQPTVFFELDEVKNDLEPYEKLWKACVQWQRLEKKWLDGDFQLNVDQVDMETDELFEEISELQQLFKTRIKDKMQAEAQKKHVPLSTIYDEDSETDLQPPLKICKIALDSISKFREGLPVIRILCNPGLRQRHWDEISEIYGEELTPDAGSSLRKYLDKHMDEYMDRFETVSLAASKEYALEQDIDKMKTEWENTKMNTTTYKDTGVKILASIEEVQLLLDDHIMKTQTMKDSPFVKPHEEQVQKWEADLLRSDATLQEWLKVQSQWLYLQQVFSSEDIQDEMPEEDAMFKEVDAVWREIMADIGDAANVVEIASQPGLLEKLTDCMETLEKINKGLNEYLEKRS